MARACSPPAREPMRSWLARRSTMATSTPASANSPAIINPVGPPPAITTAWLVFAAPISSLRSNWLRVAFYGMARVLKQAPYALHIRVGEIGRRHQGRTKRTTPASLLYSSAFRRAGCLFGELRSCPKHLDHYADHYPWLSLPCYSVRRCRRNRRRPKRPK